MNEAELVFTQLLNCNRVSLYRNRSLALDRKELHHVSSVLKRRIMREPIQYILGKTEFMGLGFKVTKDVFIPRPETELLVETAIRIVRQSFSSSVLELKILDLGTGSGCIAVSLAKFLTQANITATEISRDALAIAEYNAKLNRVAERIRFIRSDLFTIYDLRFTNYDMIVSNPPYIPTLDIENLEPELKYEPVIALDGGKGGLDFYFKIISQAADYLEEEGFLIMEIGFNQRNSVEEIIRGYRRFKLSEVIKDYNHIDRLIVAQKLRNRKYG